MRLITIHVLFGLLLITGCVSGDRKATELLDTARFEEKQHNLEHAARLYDEIIKNYPGTPAAKEATARRAVLGAAKP